MIKKTIAGLLSAFMLSSMTFAANKDYIVSSELQFMPFTYADENNESAGFDIDLIRAIAKVEGLDITFTRTVWAELIPSIENDKADIIAAGMTITPERAKKVDFTDPYFYSEQLFLLSPKNKVENIEQIKSLKISVQPDTSSEEALKSFTHSNNISLVKTTYLGIREILLGKVDGTIADSGAINYYKKRLHDKNFYTFPLNEEKEPFGFAVKKGNKELLDKLNHGLETIKSNGEYQRIYQKYFAE